MKVIVNNEPALQADFYLRQNYQRKCLAELLEVKEQLITLNLSNMPVKDEDLKTIANSIIWKCSTLTIPELREVG